MSQSAYSVSELLQTIKFNLESQATFKSFWIKGDISNFTAHRSGHWYFTLKDEGARISCIMFANAALGVHFGPKEGDKVLVKASVTVYPPQGSLQINVSAMTLDGIGDLFLQFEKLKKKLFEEGLFDPSHKKQIPIYPESIGIITGAKTAALQDILKTLNLRWPGIKTHVYESLVQGESAALQLIERLKYADTQHHDVLILARGGGSIEDLWGFNDERLARTIYNLSTPLVSGIGHEVDVTIADYVADVRAATPTAAAQVVIRDFREVKNELSQSRQILIKLIHQRLNKAHLDFSNVRQYSLWSNPELLTQDLNIHLTMMTQGLFNYASKMKTHENRLKALNEALRFAALQSIRTKESLLNSLKHNVLSSLKSTMTYKMTSFSQSVGLLNAYSPLNVIQRGYSITSKDGLIIRSIQEVNINDDLNIRIKDGEIRTVVTQKESYGKEKL
ncbi:MAG: exodeoxyribonuclease VII large subunit [Erysipelotrichaceae bacterium]|nr:MAG: exodeoxyribonuclease VII large subunit [Erysipelotrichaceae bacterium]